MLSNELSFYILNCKMPKHIVQNGTPQYQPKIQNLVSGNENH